MSKQEQRYVKVADIKQDFGYGEITTRSYSSETLTLADIIKEEVPEIISLLRSFSEETREGGVDM